MNFFIIKNTGDILTAAEANAVSQMITAPAAPTVARTIGVAGTLTLTSAVVVTREADSVTFFIKSNWVASVTGVVVIAITPPVGWSVNAATVSNVITASVIPKAVAELFVNQFYLDSVAAQGTDFSFRVRITKD